MANEHTTTHFRPLPRHSYNSPNQPVLLPKSSQVSLGPTVLLSLLFPVKCGLSWWRGHLILPCEKCNRFTISFCHVLTSPSQRQTHHMWGGVLRQWRWRRGRPSWPYKLQTQGQETSFGRWKEGGRQRYGSALRTWSSVFTCRKLNVQ